MYMLTNSRVNVQHQLSYMKHCNCLKAVLNHSSIELSYWRQGKNHRAQLFRGKVKGAIALFLPRIKLVSQLCMDMYSVTVGS